MGGCVGGGELATVVPPPLPLPPPQLLAITSAPDCSVWDVSTRAKLFASDLGSLGPVFDGKWCVGGKSFALASSKGISFMTQKGSTYEPKKGVAGSKAKVEGLLCLAALGGDDVMAAGGQSGSLYVGWWGGFFGHKQMLNDNTCILFCLYSLQFVDRIICLISHFPSSVQI